MVGLESLVCDGVTIARFGVCDPLYEGIEGGVSWSFECGVSSELFGQLVGPSGVIHWLCSIVVQIGRTVLRGSTDVVLLE